ncbi:MAG: CoA activase [Firmicutes bacterium]|nr:CoA activase [Bacillota bacterium]
MKVTGLCLGATNMSLVTVQGEEGDIRILEALTIPHEGELRQKLLKLLAGRGKVRLCATGRKFRHLLRVPTIPEPKAVEEAYAFCRREEPLDAIVSAGGETFILYEIDQQGKIGNVHTGNKCASGTGEFFLQQVTRMDLTPAEAIEAAAGCEPYPVASRCSVFCKSDCTHALNKGEKKGRVVAGLCRMMAGKILELSQKAAAKRIFLTGGTAQNKLMVDFLAPQLSVFVPPQAPYFEALGAALWGLGQDLEAIEISEETLFGPPKGSFSFRPPLRQARHWVEFKTLARGKAQPGDRLLLGLDVGSTTTKAVLLREEDSALVASIYLRTSGDPVQASRNCYRKLAEQVPAGVKIIGLGVTGSGRYIAGLHALTQGVINEIIAHAAAALHFDGGVDTILEIGGQDAKYTYLVNGVPADYAMNEACSAGTGSFLEEAAWETLEVETSRIGDIALTAQQPPNFNDQCAAFISSDIKTAVQEGNTGPDILAGLVYSICLNYLTRVKGNRPVGQRVFMQGGVCYNKAVPVAMAALLEKEIVVPPEPGLMGAFGVALEVGERLRRGLLAEESYDLRELARREIEYAKPFVCPGDEGCDRNCTIKVLKIRGKKYPFGGACSRYTGLARRESHVAGTLDMVYGRERLLFAREKAVPGGGEGRGRVGISRSLMVNEMYPLYHHFFTSLGFVPVLAERPEAQGLLRQGAPFCHPVELAHGYILDLLAKEPAYIFLPQVKGIPAGDTNKAAVCCPLVQGEPYYLRATFPELDEYRLLSPVLDFSRGYDQEEEAFLNMGQALGVARDECAAAFRAAVKAQENFKAELQARGQRLLARLEADPDQRAIVVFGRPYNAFSTAGNMGIPHKFAARGWQVIPCDFLPTMGEEAYPNMYWAAGQTILQAARLVQRHPQLFGVYITNFSCGPDSFLLGYFRQIMGDKPSLTLELDGHTADAGLDTRVEAFLDIVQGYLELGQRSGAAAISAPPARTTVTGGRVYVHTSQGERLPLNDPRVKFLIPAMGEEGNRYLAASLQRAGVKAIALAAPGEQELKLGQGHSNCKECLPLQLTVGSLLRYLKENDVKASEQLVFFMPDTSGPCRFGQYQVFINQLIRGLGLTNVATLSLSSENSYGGLGLSFTLKAWLAIIIADVMSDVKQTLLTLAQDQEEGHRVYGEVCDEIVASLARDKLFGVGRTLSRAARKLAGIKLTARPEDTPRVAILGEIYVRADGFSRQGLIKYLATNGIIAQVAPVHEWLYYCDYLLKEEILRPKRGLEGLTNQLQAAVKVWLEGKVKKVLSASGLYHHRLVRVAELIAGVEHLISPQLTGEAILTIAGALTEVIDDVAGVIAIGPFGCMPNRIAEAVAGKCLGREKVRATRDIELARRVLSRQAHLPFMAIETDGNVFPQVVEARLESFVLQVKRLHGVIQGERAALGGRH